MVEAADKNRGIGSKSTFQGNACIFQGVVDIFQYQPLLWIQCQELVLGDVEKGAIEVSGIFREIVSSLNMKL